MFFFTAGLGILYVLDASKRPGTDSIESAVWPFYSMLQEGPPFTQTVEGSCVLSAIFSVPADPSQKRWGQKRGVGWAQEGAYLVEARGVGTGEGSQMAYHADSHPCDSIASALYCPSG